MFVEKYQINLSKIPSGTTATTINIPLNMEFQLVDQAELIERVLVEPETEKAINPIFDYERVRFVPLGSTNQLTNTITYRLDLSGNNNYGSIGFVYDDINLEKESFKQTFLNLSFYDTPNRLTQKLVTQTTIFSTIKPENLNNGILKPINTMLLEYRVESPIFNPLSESEGFHLYDYKDELQIGESKYLYMRATFKNAKTGKITNLMSTSSTNKRIDQLITTTQGNTPTNNIFTKYILKNINDQYYYELDTTYSTNIQLVNNDYTVDLYQITAI